MRTEGSYDREKHLEFVQAAIARQASNSFAVKTWAVGLVTATIAYAIEKGGSGQLIAIAFVPVVSFAAMDAYYLQQERLFRTLYDAIRVPDDGQPVSPYAMGTKRFQHFESNSYWCALRSLTVAGFYIPFLLVVSALLLAR